MSSRTPVIIAIEGNIGAGKSTILGHLADEFRRRGVRAAFMPEPVDIWTTITDECGVPILSKFYANPEKYAFPFQIMAYSTRLATLRKTIAENEDCDVLVCERSLEADRNIFAKMLFADGMMDHVMYQVYDRLYQDTSAEFVMDAVVYLDVESEKCMERIQKRNRGGENNISLEYLNRCREYYSEWMKHIDEDKLMRINTTEDVTYSDNDAGVQWVSNICEFIHSDTVFHE